MLPIHKIEIFLRRIPLELQDIVLELRNIIAAVAPDAVEVIRWRGLGYFHEGSGGIVSAGICQIGIHEGYIRLDFIHGIFLADRHHLLEGMQKVKRYVRIKSYQDAPWEDLRELTEEASHFNPRIQARQN